MNQTREDHLELTWAGARHRFEFNVIDGDLIGRLFVSKLQGSQELSVVLPDDVTIEMIREAWISQGSAWKQLFVSEGPPFVAVRAIVLRDGQAILWHVYHLNDRPFDALSAVHDLPV